MKLNITHDNSRMNVNCTSVCIQRLRFHTNQLRKINKTKLVIQKADSNTILIYSDEFIMVLYDATRWLYDDDDGDDEIFVNKQPNIKIERFSFCVLLA